MKKEYDPLLDLKQAFEHWEMYGKTFSKIRMIKSRYDFMIEKSGCKNEDEVRVKYLERFGKELCKIELLEG